MRMLVISLSILLLLIGLWGCFYYASVYPVTNYYWDNLSKLSDIVVKDDWERAKIDIDTYTNKWRETKELWIFFLNQKDIDNIDSSMNKLNAYINNKDKVLAQAELEHLKVMFYVVDQNESLSLENIF